MEENCGITAEQMVTLHSLMVALKDRAITEDKANRKCVIGNDGGYDVRLKHLDNYDAEIVVEAFADTFSKYRTQIVPLRLLQCPRYSDADRLKYIGDWTTTRYRNVETDVLKEDGIMKFRKIISEWSDPDKQSKGTN